MPDIIPPKIKGPRTFRDYFDKLVVFVAVLIGVYVFFIPKEDEIAKVTENEVHAYRMMMEPSRVRARLSSADDFLLRNDEDQISRSLTLPDELAETWHTNSYLGFATATSPGGSMWCRLDLRGSSTSQAMDYRSTIKSSIERGVFRMLDDNMMTVTDFGIERYPTDNDELLFRSRTVARWRGRALYEYSYHIFHVVDNRFLYHFCASPFFEDSKRDLMLSVLRGVQVEP